jgi:hypothetical protein
VLKSSTKVEAAVLKGMPRSVKDFEGEVHLNKWLLEKIAL